MTLSALLENPVKAGESMNSMEAALVQLQQHQGAQRDKRCRQVAALGGSKCTHGMAAAKAQARWQMRTFFRAPFCCRHVIRQAQPATRHTSPPTRGPTCKGCAAAPDR